jgi:vancomycin resistance protein VanJ
MAQQTQSLTIKQHIGRLLLVTCNVCAAYPIVHLLLRAILGERMAATGLMGNLLQWWLLLTFLLLVVMLALRRWGSAAMGAANIVVFFWLFGELFLPSGGGAPPAEENSITLTVMTYNVGDGLAEPEALVAAIRASDADIIALQEVTAGQAAALERELQTVYPYQPVYGEGVPGRELLSRYPVLETESLTLQTPQFPHLRAMLDVNGIPLRIIIAHPPPPQVDIIWHTGSADTQALGEMATSGGPTILLGDFNAADQSVNYATLARTGLNDAFREAGWGFGWTYPARIDHFASAFPLVRIDYIWYTDDFRATRAWVGPDAGSDHLPVLAELVWEEMR